MVSGTYGGGSADAHAHMRDSATLTRDQWFCRIVLLFTVWFGFFWGVSDVPLFDVDEGAFSEATREMFVRGDFLATFLNGEPRYDKPILFYWLQALGVWALGVNPLAFRLPSALVSLLWVGALYLFVRRLAGPAAASRAALIMAGSLQIIVISRAATADPLLNLCIAASMLCLYLYLHGAGRIYLYSTAVAMGLGFLTKGPVALLIPVTVSLLYCLSYGRLRDWLRMLGEWRAGCVFAAIAAPWYVAVFLRDGDGFFRGFFLKHNVERFHSPLQGHSGALWYYLPVMLLGLLPYTPVLINVLRNIKGEWRDPLARYALLWFAVVLVLFSAAGTKLPHYLLYGYTGLFALFALRVERLHSPFWALLPSGFLLVVLLGLPQIAGILQSRLTDPYLREVVAAARQEFSASYYVWTGIAFVALVYGMIDRRAPLFAKLALTGMAIAVILSQFVMPAVIWGYQRPIVEAAARVRDDPRPVVMWSLNMPSFSVYSGKIVAKHRPVAGDLVITKTKALPQLPMYQLLYQKQGVSLVEVLP